VIDHNAVAAIGALSQSQLDDVAAKFNFYFVHASVGSNIMDGIRSLNASDPSRYKLTAVTAGATPPGALRKGSIYEYGRGNPDWHSKVDGFATYLSNGWGNKANVVLNKFCYIDPGATLQYYALANANNTAMSQLESLYPNTTFVYMTIPLTTGRDSDNIKRNTFNTQLREWVAANNKVLFDVADIEAYDSNNAAQTFVSGGQSYQMLYSDYTSDGGHLSTAGQRRVALGFYALGAGLLPEPSSVSVLAIGVMMLLGRRR
jgi:hypothetical protein